jgi:endonuclease/exonuclease/phosphatase family metal-dependent hydrolase
VIQRLCWTIPILALACSSGSGGSSDDVPAADAPDATAVDAPAATTLSAVTFNTGLAVGFVDHANERLPLIGPAVAKLGADVVCLQEVWNLDARAAVLDATKTVYPNVHLTETKDETGGGPAACTVDEVQPLKTCVEKFCAAVDPANLATCALTNCNTEFAALSSGCSTCIASNIGKPIADILTACTTASTGSYAYEGRNGVILLSRHTLDVKEATVFESYLNVRVALHGRLTVAGFGAVDVYCTHLTATLSDVKYAGKAASWAAEQAAQIDALNAWIDKTAVAGGPVLVLGDLNCGPGKGTEYAAELPDNFKKFTDIGFQDPYAGDATTPCSWCATNPLVRDGKNMQLDHVLAKNLSSIGKAEAARVLDGPVTLTVEGKPVESRLSDHYGVQVTFPAPMK